MFKSILTLLVLANVLYSCSQENILQVHDGESGINISFKGIDRLTGLKVAGPAYANESTNPIDAKIVGDFVAVRLTTKGDPINGPEEFYGSFFDSIPGFEKGITLWRYKPWNAWTKPILINGPDEIEDWDVQFFYWRYDDGLYGSVMPMSGNGYRTTLGKKDGKFGAKSTSLGPPEANMDTVPQMLIGFGDDPYELFRLLYKTGITEMGMPENMQEKKPYPERMDFIGWCTWNASDNGKQLTEDFVVESVKTFTDNDFPLGWVMIDDGWFDHKNRMLNSLRPDPEKFPKGFTAMNKRLKEECGIEEIGVWHTLNGYWNGINIDSELGEKYKDELFSWETKPWAVPSDSLDSKTYHFIKPDSPALPEFYQEMHQYFKDEGFSFLKVDNQLVTEQMAPKNYPVFTLSKKMHKALYNSADEFFDGTIINCMNMTAEAYLNFGTSAVARSVEDYFPAEEESGVGYKLPYGNAAVHLVMGLYNSLYFQHMVYPDLDMFESYNPDGEFHALARAMNNGPVYITDKPGEQDFEILRRLCYSDGRLIRPSKALTPTQDCLFQIQEAKPFKAFSMSGNVGLLGVWNMADTDTVEGQISANDVYGIDGDEFIVYEYFSKMHWNLKRDDTLDVMLSRMQTQLFFIIPAKENVGVLGLVDKYNAPGTILDTKITKKSLKTTLADHGLFSAIIPKTPKSVEVDGSVVGFNFDDELLTVEIIKEDERKNHTVEVQW
ncbi:Sip1-related alpha-galactosidase [Flagellimonas sp. HSM57]|nr:Sip1-related alpha-galactosidase [Flagellimonas sp. HSM57]